MSRYTRLLPQTAESSFTLTSGSLFQRKCLSGRYTVAGEGCAERRRKQGQLQRIASNHAEPENAPPIVYQVLRSRGRPLDQGIRSLMEERFGRDFSKVRVHTDARAAQSARAVNAQAYTVGNNIVFEAGQYALGTTKRRKLLAHELTHVVQQQPEATMPPAELEIGSSKDAGELEAEHMANAIELNASLPQWPQLGREPKGNVLQRRGIFAEIAGLFRGDSFDDEELQRYLTKLDRTGTIEDFTDSDNKARAIVRLWKRGDSAYILPVRRKILLIQEMLSGFTGNDDERAILDLLSGSTDAELSTILARIGRATLDRAFHGEEQTRLDRLLAARPDREQSPRSQEQSRTSEASTEVFEAETVLEAQRRFTSNAELGRQIRLNCIEIVRQMAPQLLRDDLRLSRRVSRGLGRLRNETLTMKHAGNVLTSLGAAIGPVEIRFNNGNGLREPTAMTSSAWDSIINMVGNVQGWHVFGLAVFDGYHSVTVLVDNRPDGPRVYWADQWAIDPGEDFDQEAGSVSGFRRYERVGFDKFITDYTISRWNHVHSPDSECGKRHPRNWDRACRYNASLLIWKFRSRRPTSGSP